MMISKPGWPSWVRPTPIFPRPALFSPRALETPGGLKIQTIHAFCERLLRRFPLEAGVPPGFSVMDDQAAEKISRRARDEVALHAGAHPDEAIGEAYRRMSIELDFASFNDMFAELANRRTAIANYVGACAAQGGVRLDVWRRCGFERPTTVDEVDAQAMGRMRWRKWRETAATLIAGRMSSDREQGRKMAELSPSSRFADVWAVFSTRDGSPRRKLVTQSVDPVTAAWLETEQDRHAESRGRLLAARIAQDTIDVLALGAAYVKAYETAKRDLDALDFGDLVTRSLALLADGANAAWVLYKLDSGIEHVLLDEAQDTSPEQWGILNALTAEFFHGGSGRGVGGSDGVRRRRRKAVDLLSFQGATSTRAPGAGSPGSGAPRTGRRPALFPIDARSQLAIDGRNPRLCRSGVRRPRGGAGARLASGDTAQARAQGDARRWRLRRSVAAGSARGRTGTRSVGASGCGTRPQRQQAASAADCPGDPPDGGRPGSHRTRWHVSSVQLGRFPDPGAPT